MNKISLQSLLLTIAFMLILIPIISILLNSSAESVARQYEINPYLLIIPVHVIAGLFLFLIINFLMQLGARTVAGTRLNPLLNTNHILIIFLSLLWGIFSIPALILFLVFPYAVVLLPIFIPAIVGYSIGSYFDSLFLGTILSIICAYFLLQFGNMVFKSRYEKLRKIREENAQNIK